MSIYQMAIMGSAALGAVIWGKIAAWTNVPTSLAVASARDHAVGIRVSRRVLSA